MDTQPVPDLEAIPGVPSEISTASPGSGPCTWACPRTSMWALPSGATSASLACRCMDVAVEPTWTRIRIGPARSSGRWRGSVLKVSTSGRAWTARSSGNSRSNANGSVTVDGTRLSGSWVHRRIALAPGRSVSEPPSASAVARPPVRYRRSSRAPGGGQAADWRPAVVAQLPAHPGQAGQFGPPAQRPVEEHVAPSVLVCEIVDAGIAEHKQTCQREESR